MVELPIVMLPCREAPSWTLLFVEEYDRDAVVAQPTRSRKASYASPDDSDISLYLESQRQMSPAA